MAPCTVDARAKYDSMKHHYEEAVQLKITLTEQLQQLQQHPGAPEESKKIAQLQEEVTFLHQQLKVYKEDFEAERRDRQRMARERDSDKLHYQSEVTSLQLQVCTIICNE